MATNGFAKQSQHDGIERADQREGETDKPHQDHEGAEAIRPQRRQILRHEKNLNDDLKCHQTIADNDGGGEIRIIFRFDDEG